MSFVKIEEGLWKRRWIDLLFYTCVFLLTLPILLLPAFPTLDGPAHAYNANLFREWYLGDQEFLSAYFSSHPFINPNLLSHLILGLAGLILEPSQAEKLMVVLCVISLPMAFRYFIRSFQEQINAFTFLILPFAYSFPLFLGFFNFCLGISVFFFAYGYWVRRGKDGGYRSKVILFILFFACYLAHLFVFLLLAGIVFLHELVIWWKARDSKNGIISVLLLLLPLLILSVWFLLRQPKMSPGGIPDPLQIMGWLFNAQSIIGLNEGYEQVFTRCISVLSILLLGGIVFRWKKFNLERDSVKSTVRLLLLVAGLGILALNFLFPDWMFGGGYLSLRLNFLFFIFLFTVIALYYRNTTIGMLCVTVVLITTSFRLVYYTSESAKHARDVPELQELAGHIPERSNVLPLIYSNEWFQGHFSNYIGKTGKVIIFENYEAETHYFPLEWKPEQNPKKHLWDLIHLQPCGDFTSYKSVTGMNIDHILVWRFNEEAANSCAKDLLRRVRLDYDTLKVSYYGNGTIFKRKQP